MERRDSHTSIKYHSWPFSNHSSQDRSGKPGLVLLILLIFMAALSMLLVYWFQNEIQFRLQAEASLKHQSIYQQLEGVLGQSIVLIRHFSETHLRENSVVLSPSEFNPFFPDWSVRSKPAQDSPFLTLDLEYQSSLEPLSFEALLRFYPYYLSDIPWFNLHSAPFASLPENIIFFNEQDRLNTLTAPRFSLLPESSSPSFDQVFEGETHMIWDEEKIRVIQGKKESLLADFQERRLHVQIRGDTSIEGDTTNPPGKLLFLEVIGNLILESPNMTPDFPRSSPRLFVHVTKQLFLQSQQSGTPSIQINGYFWIEDSCPLPRSSFQAIYWKGSLACRLNFPAQWTIPLHLLHTPYPQFPPSSFARTALLFSGARSKSF